MLALTSGGAIPEVADYRMVLEPDDTFIGTLNEDFAIESNAGDIFQLGNTSWRILQVGAGVVRVADARGAPPSLPFWLGEAPRSWALGRGERSPHQLAIDSAQARRTSPPVRWLMETPARWHPPADRQLLRRVDAIGTAAADDRVERFFGESGGMQSSQRPSAAIQSRVGMAQAILRQFNRADGRIGGALLLSLGHGTRFRSPTCFSPAPDTVKDVLIRRSGRADVPGAGDGTPLSLLCPESRGRKCPRPADAGDDLAAASPTPQRAWRTFPAIGVPDHWWGAVVRDCLKRWTPRRPPTILRIDGAISASPRHARPSPLSHEILNARPYEFVDDAPLEERRTQAVMTRRATDPATNGGLGILDANAIALVKEEVRPDPRDADELHDALVTAGFLTQEEVAHARTSAWLEALVQSGRATLLQLDMATGDLVAAERRLNCRPPAAAPDDAGDRRAGYPAREDLESRGRSSSCFK
jgi:ATP-dependent Lhr-like helicase